MDNHVEAKKFAADNHSFFDGLAGRWQDEQEYEDWQEYIEAARKRVEDSHLVFVQLKKRPFTCVFRLDKTRNCEGCERALNDLEIAFCNSLPDANICGLFCEACIRRDVDNGDALEEGDMSLAEMFVAFKEDFKTENTKEIPLDAEYHLVVTSEWVGLEIFEPVAN